MQRRGDGADGKGEAEAQADVDGDADNRRQRRVNAFQLQVAADDRADHSCEMHLELADVGGLQAGDDALRALFEVAALFAAPRAAAESATRGRSRSPYGWMILSPGIASSARRTASSLDRLLEPQRRPACRRRSRCRAAGPRVAIMHDAGQDDEQRQRDRVPAPLDEIEVGVLEEFHGLQLSDAQLRDAAGATAPARTSCATRTPP